MSVWRSRCSESQKEHGTGAAVSSAWLMFDTRDAPILRLQLAAGRGDVLAPARSHRAGHARGLHPLGECVDPLWRARFVARGCLIEWDEVHVGVPIDQ